MLHDSESHSIAEMLTKYSFHPSFRTYNFFFSVKVEDSELQRSWVSKGFTISRDNYMSIVYST